MNAGDEPSTTEEDPRNILDEALSVHDSSDEENEENENTEEKNQNSDQTFVVETANESENQKESKKTDKNGENLVRDQKYRLRSQPIKSQHYRLEQNTMIFYMNLKRRYIYNLFKHFSFKRISFITDK